MESSILKFRLRCEDPGDPMDLFDRYYPDGKTVLNRSTWMQRPPRTCCIRGVSNDWDEPGEPLDAIIEVEYRSPDFVSYVGETRYEGWDVRMICQRNGIPVGADGEPLADGAIPIFDDFEVYPDIEFDELQFGELIGETEIRDVESISIENLRTEGFSEKPLRTSSDITFLAARKSRPTGTVTLSDQPSGIYDQNGFRLFNVDVAAGHLEYTVENAYFQLMCEFLGGLVSLSCLANPDATLVYLSDTFRVATSTARTPDSKGDIFKAYASPTLLVNLGRRLKAQFPINVTVVEGDCFGLLLSHQTTEDDEG